MTSKNIKRKIGGKTYRRKWRRRRKRKHKQGKGGKSKKDILFVLLTCRVCSKTVRDFIQIAKFAKVHKICFFVSVFMLLYYWSFQHVSIKLYWFLWFYPLPPLFCSIHFTYNIFCYFWSIISIVARCNKKISNRILIQL